MSGRGPTYRLEVLGPIRLSAMDGTDLTPAGPLPRRLLALLTLHRGRAVSVDAALQVLWPRGGPNDPVAALQNHVSRLRQAMPGAIGSAAAGYRLDPTTVRVDLDVLSELLATGSGDAEDELEGILARWHGPAYAELEDVDAARPEIERVEELRTRAREVTAERRLRAGSTEGLTAELRALVDEHPLRERPRALLMDALAATGRVADALRVYDEFRRVLADEIGTDPSPGLAARHQELLAGAGVSAWNPTGVLPEPLTSLVGRDELLGELSGLLTTERLLTLVGPGGVGKTRLLLEVGRRAAAAEPGRAVALVELAATDAAGVAPSLAAALGIDLRPGTPDADRIAGVIGRTPLLVLLDNCEHVLDPTAGLVQLLLSRCPEVRLLATSRERLRVPGEHVRVIPPLSVDGTHSPAVRLFVDRSRAAGGTEAFDGSELERVPEIVGRLDGLPLAIELAAARMHAHDLDEIAAGLDRRFAFLTSGYRTSDRHGSLAATVSWSFELLDEPLRRTFVELAVFGGPFEVTGAAAVGQLKLAEASDRLARLVERSLVMRYPGRRYTLLETLRAFGIQQLDAEGRYDDVAGRHARFLADWAEEAGRSLAEPGPGAIRRIDDAAPELKRALDWLLEHDQVEDAGRIVAALLDYGLLRLRSDVLAWAGRVAEADPGDLSPVAPRVHAAAAYAAWMAGDLARAGESARRGLAVAMARDGDVPAHVYGALAVHELFAGRLRESADCYSAEAAAERAEYPGRVPMSEGTHVMVLGYLGDPAAAGLAADLAARVGDDPSPVAAYLWYCVGEALLEADPRAARNLLERALSVAEQTGTSFVTGTAGASVASLHVRLGDLAEAAAAYRRLVPHWRRAGMWSTQWVMLRSIALLLERLDRAYDAAVLVGAIHAAGQALSGSDAVTVAELDARLRERLGEERHASAREQGAALDSDALLEHTLAAL